MRSGVAATSTASLEAIDKINLPYEIISTLAILARYVLIENESISLWAAIANKGGAAVFGTALTQDHRLSGRREDYKQIILS